MGELAQMRDKALGEFVYQPSNKEKSIMQRTEAEYSHENRSGIKHCSFLISRDITDFEHKPRGSA